ncbi:AraC family transcriptional regulator [Paenibacillus sedimenti]|uniref:Helix-turn-helix transcriptional regulator n=1 Tax=Paenibacillus sedimenti TaxID=2770274 RepID=A0A926QHM9_9BACL|nr:AraC family transcriptional regulator [Paenibacillus sedimenti]MBD0378699.1 helix-turn-helix transcriptional regulator [Paenibacillus sedimenti]
MHPVRKSFFEDPMFPFDFVYQDKKSPQNELPDHLHDRFEMVYVYSGKGTFFINQTFYEMNAGDLFLIPGNTIHRAFPNADDPVMSTAVFFSPAFNRLDSFGDSYSHLYGFDVARKRNHYKIETTEPLRLQTEAILAEINEELRSKQIGYRYAIRLQFQRLLLGINRLVQSNDQNCSEDVQIGPIWMKEIMQYIDHHHVESGLSLSILAKRVSVTPAHFSRIFKLLTGMNVTDYINAKRIARAKELLLGTDDSIDRIAYRCGFDSLPHFHRMFKKLGGVTPGVYRRSR